MNFPWPFPIKSEKHLDLPPDENAKAEITLDLLIPIVAVLLISLIATVLFAKKRPLTRKIYFFYMFLSMTIHFTIELYWTLFNDKIKNGNSWFDRFWRENGKSDTRWVARDEVCFCFEFMASFFCGPMALLTIITMALDSPTQYVLQAITATAQAYGLLITWIGEIFVNMKHVPFNPVLRYGLFIAVQTPWVIFPILICIDSIKNIQRFAKAYETLKKQKKSN